MTALDTALFEKVASKKCIVQHPEEVKFKLLHVLNTQFVIMVLN